MSPSLILVETVAAGAVILAAVQTPLARASAFQELSPGLVGEGERLLADGEVEEALRRFERSAGEEPDNVTAWLDAGYAAYCLDRLAQAAASFDEALRRDPQNRYALRMRGHVAFGRGDLAEAMRWYRAALAMAPDDAAARESLEMARTRLGEVRELAAAQRHLDRWLALSLTGFVVVAAGLVWLTRSHSY